MPVSDEAYKCYGSANSFFKMALGLAPMGDNRPINGSYTAYFFIYFFKNEAVMPYSKIANRPISRVIKLVV